MLRSLTLIGLLALSSCVLLESESGPPQLDCGREGSVADNGRCHCSSDCRESDGVATCFDEHTFGFPGGVCSHSCESDHDCSTGYICDNTICRRVCTSGAGCDRGRYCSSSVDRGSVNVCWPLCDESSDCESGRCNLYSGDCLREGEEVAGAGLNAACANDADCRSQYCEKGLCRTLCDPEHPRCPEGGACVRGYCQNECSDQSADAGGDDSDAGTCSAADGGAEGD